MINPNWEIFRAKFNENPQRNFEWFCYLLFCKEFNRPYGIFRYKNQSAIETNPIELGDEVIGWQAKFYDSSLSNHKKDLLSSIEKSKRDYPKITELLFYTNQEWGQNRGEKPQGLIEIEEKAQELNIVLDWRTASYFESEFVAVQNEIFSKHFFTSEKSIFALLEEQQNHTQNILQEIQTNFSFNNKSFEIDRNNLLEKLKNKSQQIVILSGVGGVGKTVLIKKLFEQLKDNVPFYVFKATEFDLRNINELFVGFSFYDFVEAHKDEKFKIIVIDSSEKILDLKNSDPFKEFLSVLIKEKWKIIFTTRDNYLENLIYEFIEIHNIVPLNIFVNTLELNELCKIADEHSFSLPKDEKLLELIKNPFYLNEYLKFYNDKEELRYSEFKNKLWIRNIKRSSPERERCFLQIAFERANNGQFFISPNCESTILDNGLLKDGILGYEEAGYFITHDIYEEWALEKIIESEFIKKSSVQEFFNKIGGSLPVRRCFRNWVSEKLFLEDEEIKGFIEEVIESENVVPLFWKDEILVSILLSNYSKHFFDIFKDELLANEQSLLKKLTFILRIACKEVDDDFFKQLGIKTLNLFSLKYILTKPKGQGWESLIKFVFDNIKSIGLKNIHFVLPVIYDWNNKNKEGETTRLSSLIALQYYEWIISEDIYFSDGDAKEHLLKTILYGSSEIKEELKIIFDNIFKYKWTNHRDPYFDLSKIILTKFDGISVSKALPKYVLQLADLFWFKIPQKEDRYSHSLREREQKYCIAENFDFKYFPASAFQTPIFSLLQFDLKETIDFILNFTNKTVECLVKNIGEDYFYKSTIKLSDKTIHQYSNGELWGIYRGGGHAPDLLKSIHMALEKFILERAKNTSPDTLNYWLFYLLENSISASISAVVSSIVIAFPEKTFEVAKVLFQTKDFIILDKHRQQADLYQIKGYYSIGYGLNFNRQIFQDERIATCDDQHRKFSLEDRFLSYQLFRSEETTEKEADTRQKTLWQILDDYYQNLPDKSKETKSDKTWRLFLARMDKRKMNITTENTKDGVAIQFNPEIDSDIKEHSEEAQKIYIEQMKYLPLKLWAELKFNNDEKYKQYEKYENDPLLSLQEVKDILNKLKTIKAPEIYKMQHSEEESFFLFNHSIPSYVCSVLIENHFDELSNKEKSFCKDIILGVASSSLNPKYQYQISDGVQPAISTLPSLLEAFPGEKENIKINLVLNLFNEYPVGGMFSIGNFSAFPITAIHKLWGKYFNDAQSLLFGYILLKPRYDELRKRIREANYKKGIYESHDNQLMDKFLEENDENLQSVVENKLTLSDLGDITILDLRTLKTAFQLIPQKTDNEDHKKIVKIIISVFAKKIFSNDRREKIDYQIKHDFLETYAYFVLNAHKGEVQDYLLPFLDHFNASESIADLFQEIVLAEDMLNTYDKFWLVWNIFKEKVVEICKDGDRHWYVDKIVKSYLFAQVPWKETAKEWHSLKDKDKRFFKEVSGKIGHCPSAIYAISKLLNDIGSPYIDDGVIWISSMLENNPEYVNKKLETNTIYYIENLIRKFTFNNREKIKRTKTLRNNLIIILNFLIEKGSSVGYMLRESIV